jgi:hypothetical protein
MRVAVAAILAPLLTACGGSRICHDTLLSISHEADGVPAAALAPGSTLDLAFQRTFRMGCDGSTGAGAYSPLPIARADPSIVEILERREHTVVARAHRTGVVQIAVERHGERTVLDVEVAAPARAEIGSPLAGSADPALLAGADVDLPVVLRTAAGRLVAGADLRSLARLGGAVTHVGTDPLTLRVRALRAGTAEVAILDAAAALAVVDPEDVATVELDLQEDDTNIGYGCIAPAPPWDRPVAELYAGRNGVRLLHVRGRTRDGRAVAGLTAPPASATPDTCTVTLAERPWRAREVLEFHLPASRGYQRAAYELVPVAPGPCRVVAHAGDVAGVLSVSIR